MGEPNPLSLGSKPKQLTITVEAKGATSLHQLEPRFCLAKEKHLRRAIGCAINDVYRVRAYPFDTHNLDNCRPRYAAKLRTCNNLLKPQHFRPLVAVQSNMRVGSS